MKTPGLLAALLVSLHATAHAAEKPNIIYILADDMGYAAIGPFGNTDMLPTFAKLAGAEPPRNRVIDGRDFSPPMFDPKSGRAWKSRNTSVPPERRLPTDGTP